MSWKRVPLGALCHVSAGGTPSRTKSSYFEGTIPWVKISDMLQGNVVTTEESISEEGLASSSAKLFPEGTLLLSIFATVGRTAVLGIPAATNQAIAGITPRSDSEVYQPYLRHYLDASVADLVKKSRGVAQVNINLSILKDFQVPLPPLHEQRRLAAILDQAEDLRAKRRAAIALLDQLPQAIFLEMFGDPITNPKGLETALLGDLCTRITDGTHQPPKFADSGHPFLFVRNIVTGEINFDTEKFISDETHEELTRRCPIDQGDVIYSTVGSYGVPVVVRTRKKFAFQRHIAHLKPKRDKLLPEFLSGMLASPPVRRQADGFARGVAQKTINLADIRRYLVFAPPLEMQQHFTVRVEAIHRAKAAHQSALAGIDALIASLQAEVFGRSM